MYKELAEQCRTIHLALIALCFGLLVTSTSGIDSSEMLAHKEALTVSTLTERLRKNWLGNTVRKKFSTAFSGDLGKNYLIRALFLSDSKGNIYRLAIAAPWFLARPQSSSLVEVPLDTQPIDIPNYVLGYLSIKTLDEFAKTWTLLSTHSQLVALELPLSGVRITAESTSELSIPIDQSDPSLAISPIQVSTATLFSQSEALQRLTTEVKEMSSFPNRKGMLDLVNSAKKYIELEVIDRSCVLLSIGTGIIWIVQCDCEWRSSGLQKDLTFDVTPNPPPGVYTDSFPNLAKATAWIDQSPIDKLEKHLYDRAFASGEKIDIFGAKISGDAIASWGLVVLGGVYFWFLVHLFKLTSFSRASISKAIEPAWVGIYEDPLSRIAFTSTALALPFGTSLALIRMRFQSFDAMPYRWDTILALAITVTLSAAAIYCFGRLWRLSWKQLLRRQP